MTRAKLILAPAAAAAVVGTTTDIQAEQTPPPTRFHGLTAKQWAGRFHDRGLQLHHVRVLLRRRWRPTVRYSLRLASAASGVPYSELATVAWCESRYDPFATNGRYRGLFQEGPMFERGPFAQFGVFDPLANALTAGFVVSREGWRQWSCRPH